MLKVLLLGAKIALSVLLGWYALSRIDLDSAWVTLRSITAGPIVIVMILFLLQFFLAGLRLQRLLAILGTRLGTVAAVDVVVVGAFFSQTLISFVGGDAMRVWRMVRARVPVGIAAKGVLFDRVAGFAGMFLIVLATAPLLVPMLDSAEMTIGLLLVLGGGLAGVLALLLVRRVPRAWIRHRATRLLDNLLTSGLDIWRSREGAMLVVGLSVGIQLLNVVILYVLSEGLGAGVQFVDGVLLFPTVLFLSMLPISVAGWGVREGAMIAALGLVGIAPSVSLALSVCFGLCLIAVSLPGGVLWFTRRATPVALGDAPQPAHPAAPADRHAG